MEHYVTLFDAGFLPQGLALAQSLREHGGAHTLWVVCMDDETYEVLSSLRLPSMRLLRLADVETPELLAVKSGRSRAEYCWTLTPFTPRAVFDREPAAQRVTYVDADVRLLRHPRPIFEELERAGKHVLITEHAYAKPYERSAALSGIYCVQFITFTRDGGETVRKWWSDRCIEWCFARYEAGKFGDQKYLDDWPTRFPSQAHVLERRGWALAPWNATVFPHGDAVFYHFHGLRITGDGAVDRGYYPLPRAVAREIYVPYERALTDAIAAIRGVRPWNVRQRDLAGRIKAAAYRAAFRVRGLWFRLVASITPSSRT